MSKIKCPKCNDEIWDIAKNNKLHKCWNCMLAFDTPANSIDAIFDRNKCTQCKKESAFLSDVCMKCAKKNHRKAMR